MKKLAKLAARLYPKKWRARYGAELDALLQDSPARWMNLVDILKGAAIMQVKCRWSVRFAAALAIVCGLIGLVFWLRTGEPVAVMRLEVRTAGCGECRSQVEVRVANRDSKAARALAEGLVEKLLDASLDEALHGGGRIESVEVVSSLKSSALAR